MRRVKLVARFPEIKDLFQDVKISKRPNGLFDAPKNRRIYGGLVEVGGGERINVTVDDMARAYRLAKRQIREYLDTATQGFVGVDYQFIPEQGETSGVRVILNFRDYMRPRR